MAISTFIKDPSSELDYTMDWSTAIGADTISSSTWTLPAGITQTAATNTTTAATIWLSGGTAGTNYEIVNRIVTAGGRTDERTMRIMVIQT